MTNLGGSDRAAFLSFLGPFVYTSATNGELDSFWGLEQITRGGEAVYELRYAGGFLG